MSPEVFPIFRTHVATRQGQVKKPMGSAGNRRRYVGNSEEMESPNRDPAMVVDLHCYLFNHRFLPIERIFISEGVPRPLAGLARRLIILLAGKTDVLTGSSAAVFDGVSENDSLEPLADLLTDLVSRGIAERMVNQGPISFEGSFLERVAASQVFLKSDLLYAVLGEIEGMAWRGTQAEVVRFQVDQVASLVIRIEGSGNPADPDIAELIGNWAFKRFRRALSWFLEELHSSIKGDAFGAASDLIRFFLLMLCEETNPHDSLFGICDKDRLLELDPQDLRAGKQDRGNEGSTGSLLRERSMRIDAGTRDGSRDFVGFVSFDSRRGGGMRIVKFPSNGKVDGVMVYPQMGCPAYGTGAENQARYEALYSHCSRRGIPILTYCSLQDLEEDEFSGVHSDPEYWLRVLGDYRDLNLCYGHAGGGGEIILDRRTGLENPHFGWYSTTDDQWAEQNNFARQVVEQCCRFPNVFCDFSYFGSMVKDQERAAHFKRNLISALGGPRGDLHFGNKIMFGCDWRMPRMMREASELLAFWMEFFDDQRIAPFRDGFFYKNALRFLNLGPRIENGEEWPTASLSDPKTEVLMSVDEVAVENDRSGICTRRNADRAQSRHFSGQYRGLNGIRKEGSNS